MSEVGELVPVHLIDRLFLMALQNISTLRCFGLLHVLKVRLTAKSGARRSYDPGHDVR